MKTASINFLSILTACGPGQRRGVVVKTKSPLRAEVNARQGATEMLFGARIA